MAHHITTGTLLAEYDSEDGSITITQWVYDRSVGADEDTLIDVASVESLGEAIAHCEDLDLRPVGTVDRDDHLFTFRVEA